MPIGTYATLCVLAALAGAVNAIAGGGTLLTFPALCVALEATGIPRAAASVVANGTSTVALVPGALAAIFGYRREIEASRRWALVLAAPSLLGGLVGSLLVVTLPENYFHALVPWLLLTAATLFALQPRIARWTGIGQAGTAATHRTMAGAVAFQFGVAVYGGYFGAGIGILMLSALALMGLTNIHQMNALKSLLNALINAVSAAVFIWGGKVHWPFALAMALSAIVGGYAAAHTARRFESRHVRAVVVVIGFVLAAVYFYRQMMPAEG
jgi:uncharacterized membrane protein YfcA